MASRHTKAISKVYTITGTDTVVRPVRLVCKTGEIKFDILGVMNKDTTETLFIENGRPISFKVAHKRNLITGA